MCKHLHLFVEFFGWYETKDSLFIAMEYLEHGDLHKHIIRTGICSENDAKAIAYQLLEGLGVMHEMGFAHRDLKPQVRILLQSIVEALLTFHRRIFLSHSHLLTGGLKSEILELPSEFKSLMRRRSGQRLVQESTEHLRLIVFLMRTPTNTQTRLIYRLCYLLDPHEGSAFRFN